MSVSLSTTDASSNPHKATNMVHPSVVSEFDSCIAALALPTSEKKVHVHACMSVKALYVPIMYVAARVLRMYVNSTREM